VEHCNSGQHLCPLLEPLKKPLSWSVNINNFTTAQRSLRFNQKPEHNILKEAHDKITACGTCAWLKKNLWIPKKNGRPQKNLHLSKYNTNKPQTGECACDFVCPLGLVFKKPFFLYDLNIKLRLVTMVWTWSHTMTMHGPKNPKGGHGPAEVLASGLVHLQLLRHLIHHVGLRSERGGPDAEWPCGGGGNPNVKSECGIRIPPSKEKVALGQDGLPGPWANFEGSRWYVPAVKR